MSPTKGRPKSDNKKGTMLRVRIDDDMVVDGPLLTLFGGRIFAFIPHWAKFFDSHRLPDSVSSDNKK